MSFLELCIVLFVQFLDPRALIFEISLLVMKSLQSLV